MKRLLSCFAVLCLLAAFCPPAFGATMIRQNAAWYRVHLGTGIVQPVTTEEVDEFIDTVITKQFPDGLTIVEARGQWTSEAHGLIKERTVIVDVQCEDTDENFDKIRDIADRYIRQFERAKASCFIKRVSEVTTILYYQQ